MRPKLYTAWLLAHARLLTYVAGSCMVTAWTLLRFLTQRTIFDLVGQQVLAGQWLHGHISGSNIGVTNYLVKIFVLYMPLHVMPGSPRLKLIILTIAVNVATFVLLGLIAERILRDFGVRVGGALYSGLLWLSAIAGSVFWMQFTNSRNVEVVGGLLLIWLGLRQLERPSRRLLLGIACFSTLLFFADTLQIYMTALPLLAYGCLRAWLSGGWKRIGLLATALAIGFVASKFLFTVVTHLLSLHILQPATGAGLSAHFLLHGLSGTVKGLLHLYAGGAGAGRLREFCNVLFTILVASALVIALQRKLVSRRLLLLIGCIFVFDCAVYVLSGEAQQSGTERYLIMTAPAALLLVGSLQNVWSRFRKAALLVTTGLFLINAVLIGHAIAANLGDGFAQDAHLASVRRYLISHPHTLLYSSMDTSLPMAYLYGSDTNAPLPLTCAGSTLQKNSTFYDKASFHMHESTAHTEVGIVLDGTAITNVPSVCSIESITSQFGQPRSVTATDDGSTVLLFPSDVSQKLRY